MSEGVEQRRGWCPSVWLPMASGDGLIVRVHAGSHGLRSEHARSLADLAQAHGNGQLDITRRANLQLRGASEASLPALQRALVQAGLAPSSPGREPRQHVLVDPLSGLDGTHFDFSGLAQAVCGRLAAAEALADVPAKFGIVLDAGSGLVAHVAAHIRIVVTGRSATHAQIEVATPSGPVALAPCPLADVPETVFSLTRARAEQRPVASGPEIVSQALRGAYGAIPGRRFAPEHGAGTSQSNLVPPAALAFHGDGTGWFGLGIPFGSADAPLWRALASLADEYGVGELRVTPARGVILPGVRAHRAPALLRAAQALGLIVSADDPLLHAVACPGAPACSSAYAETRAMAREVAMAARSWLQARGTLHVSGCSKSCAHSGAAQLTIVHAADGPRLGLSTDVAHVLLGPALPRESVLSHVRALSNEAAVSRVLSQQVLT